MDIDSLLMQEIVGSAVAQQNRVEYVGYGAACPQTAHNNPHAFAIFLAVKHAQYNSDQFLHGSKSHAYAHFVRLTDPGCARSKYISIAVISHRCPILGN